MRVVGRCEATIINPVGSEELTNVTLFVRQGGRLRRRNAGIQRSFSAVLFLLPLLFAHTAHGDINAELLEAAKVGDTVKLKQLVNQGADVNAKTDKGTTALMWAAYKNHIEFVKVLIDADHLVRSSEAVVGNDDQSSVGSGSLVKSANVSIELPEVFQDEFADRLSLLAFVAGPERRIEHVPRLVLDLVRTVHHQCEQIGIVLLHEAERNVEPLFVTGEVALNPSIKFLMM